MLRIASWNVNGIRSISKKGFFEWLQETKPDILGIQESKIDAGQLTELLTAPPGYKSFWSHHALKKGYSGVALYVKDTPKKIETGFGVPRFDDEGRTLVADYEDFVLYNIYFPNGKASEERLLYKMDFYEAFISHAKAQKKKGRKIIVCGDFNTAHKEIDLARPKDNVNVSGFMPKERELLDRFTKAGYIDTFRAFNSDPHNYTWWHMRTAARERNVGWRIDYFFADDSLGKYLKGAAIESKIMGSDHCPITIDLAL